MIALSWLSSAVVALGGTLAGGLWLVVGGPFWLAGVIVVVILAAGSLALWSLRKLSVFLARMTAVATAVRAGGFEQRLIFPDARGSMKAAMDAFNGVIDINDAFVREAELAMAAAAEGRYYRKIRPEGMRGAFLKSSTGINKAIDLMAARQEMIAAALGEVRRLAAAATDGDLDQRIKSSSFTGEYLELTDSMNRLVETVAGPIEEAGSVLDAMARTDLTVRMRGAYGGAFARLQQDTNAVADNMSGILGELRGTARALKNATGEILSGTNDLARRTTTQAAAVEETSAAMEQLAATVIENAKRAETASARAQSVSQAAEQSGAMMGEASAAMDRISTSTAKISGIIGLIDDIAFQTNLLALNASVEAARAGDAGKGFAVVAVEVRRLAQSAAQASAEVKALVTQSTAEVDGGAKLIADVAAKLGTMLEGVRESGELIRAIAKAGLEQSEAISEVSTAVRQMDEMTQHNAALVEETNAAIEQTEGQAQRLDSIVDTFIMGDAEETAAPMTTETETPLQLSPPADRARAA